MDWIEKLFGISPDAGSGSTETAYIVAIVFAITLAVAWARGYLGFRR